MKAAGRPIHEFFFELCDTPVQLWSGAWVKSSNRFPSKWIMGTASTLVFGFYNHWIFERYPWLYIWKSHLSESYYLNSTFNWHKTGKMGSKGDSACIKFSWRCLHIRKWNISLNKRVLHFWKQHIHLVIQPFIYISYILISYYISWTKQIRSQSLLPIL